MLHNMQGPDVPQIAVQQSKARIRKAASKTQEATTEILNRELANNLPVELRGYWHRESTISKRSIQRQRRKYSQAPKVFK